MYKNQNIKLILFIRNNLIIGNKLSVIFYLENMKAIFRLKS